MCQDRKVKKFKKEKKTKKGKLAAPVTPEHADEIANGGEDEK